MKNRTEEKVSKNYLRSTTDGDPNVKTRPDHVCRNAIFDLREKILSGDIDRSEDLDVIQAVCYNMSNRHLGPVMGLGVTIAKEEGVVLDQATQWSLDHPTRLTGESLERDYLDGPDCMLQNDYGESAMERMVWERDIRIRNFFRVSGTIKKALTHKNKLLMAKVAKRFWERCFNQDDKLWLTVEQKSAIVWLLDKHYKEYPKVKKTPWGPVATDLKHTLLGHPDDRNRAECGVGDIYSDNVEGGINPETQMILAEEIAN
jgi:hypothetical protein